MPTPLEESGTEEAEQTPEKRERKKKKYNSET